MMENVPKLGQHSLFLKFCRELQALGYVVNHDVKDASRYGVPQGRRRLILFAALGGSVPLAEESSARRTVRGAIGGLGDPKRSRDPVHSLSEKVRTPRIQALIRDIPKNGGTRGDLAVSRQLACHQKMSGFHDVYGRMAWDDVAPTITGGCYNPSKGRFLHPEEDRAITMREAALLQGFPRRYYFDTSRGKGAVALMIGNALPPEFVRRHAVGIRNTLTNDTVSRSG